MNILLAVCGSISAHKSIDLVRELAKDGHQVIVVLTKGATEFILPTPYLHLGASKVYKYNEDFKHTDAILHIELARWCDRLVISPITANTIGKLANGLADDLLSNIYLALQTDRPKIIFPAMNSVMLENPTVKENLKKLAEVPNTFIHPTTSGLLACNEEGMGKLADLQELLFLSLSIPREVSNSKKVLITAGATIAPVDNIRYLTNPSSGITGKHLVTYFLSAGHQVTLVYGKNSKDKFIQMAAHPNLKMIEIGTAKEMKKEVDKYIDQQDLYISSAAICDIEFKNQSGHKIKKSDLGSTLPIGPEIDILGSIIEKNIQGLKIVGFAAETNLTDNLLFEKMKRKPVDLLVGTEVSSGNTSSEIKGFINDRASYAIFGKGRKIQRQELLKKDLAKVISDQVFND